MCSMSCFEKKKIDIQFLLGEEGAITDMQLVNHFAKVWSLNVLKLFL